ncbi:MAG: CopG family transcriptional regulator [Proteobacteria bacterium]|nr:CopG family transcriptional regulator [Pseudomonadota bacterium]MBU2226767.1 CopG family transcriptional regulator [Pseudomonadota bacterium]MBU2262415.1 CopG family transcriptional regulator [Pseudomonadota bacterium]
MPGVKTAISLNEELLIKVSRLADDLHVSRSKVFTLAVQDYLKKQENQSLLAQLNEAYEDFPSEEERGISKSMRIKHNNIIEQESW